MADSPLDRQDLVISNGSTLWCEGANRTGQVNGEWAGYGVTIEAASITVDATSKISADGLGYALGGPGQGGSSGAASGGGHGGRGGVSWSGTAGGLSYGSAVMPVTLGSSSGVRYDYGMHYRAGGGAIRLVVDDEIRLEGTISANGAQAPGAPGGAGGSVLIEANRTVGTGLVSAKGGDEGGATYYGGSGGGRIAVYYQSSTFTGQANCSVAGGSGCQAGEPGHWYSRKGPALFWTGSTAAMAPALLTCPGNLCWSSRATTLMSRSADGSNHGTWRRLAC